MAAKPTGAVMRTLLAVLLITIALASPPAGADEVKHPATRAVLVTGATTGIGRRITERLAAAGHFVYAGARKDADLAALNKIQNVQAIRLDVTKPEEIDAAVVTITKAGRGLYGLVNNAGIAAVGSTATVNMDEFDLQMKVNVYGPVRMARAFVPLLTASKGRITNIGSISGILAGRNIGGYAMTKHAIEAFTDSLAAELEPGGVIVNVVEPGNYNSEISASAAKRAGKDLGWPTDRSNYKEPDEVAAAVEKALFDASPKRRYLVTPNQRETEITIRKQIEQLAQLNSDHPYSYDRETLIRFLDEALAKAPPKN
jgi:NAD(P)-dependent dehydrogenase (short-subunit alcohol dehydrogenase family)